MSIAQHFEEHPHAPDIEERTKLDNGFSRGWGFHFQPNEAYWLDCHNHMEKAVTPAQICKILDAWFYQLDAFRLGRITALVTDTHAFPVYRDITAHDPRFTWMFRIAYDQPDVEAVKRAFAHGALGLKLHNSPLMAGKAGADVWRQKAWQEIFAVVNDSGKALLWHITQRKSISPYHGGGENPYWREAKNGLTTSNEELLQTALSVAKNFPQLTLIGAHQMHIGLERLAAIFAEHPNVVIDSSCGFFVRWADELYPEDRAILRSFFLQYPDRILFATDSSLQEGSAAPYQVQSFLCHARFVLQLRLPDAILQQVAHGNAERILRLKPLEPVRRYNARP